jgi:hypothetical protein
MPLEPSKIVLNKYRDPLPIDFTWTSADNSKSHVEMRLLEVEFGFKFRAVTGSFNFLVNTSTRVMFAVRKCCKFMYMPGRPHFKAIKHLLYHIWCYPPGALKFYCDMTKSPLTKMLKEAGHGDIDPSFCGFTDSSWHDCDDGRSTGCYMHFLQGGIVDMNSFVPPPIAMSSAESENNTLCVGTMTGIHLVHIVMELRHGNTHRPYTLPIFVDSEAAIAMNLNDKDTKRTRHIQRRWQYTRHAQHRGDIRTYHVNGDLYQLADVGTKNLRASAYEHKMAIMEVPLEQNGDFQSKRGDGARAEESRPAQSDESVASETCRSYTRNSETSLRQTQMKSTGKSTEVSTTP